MPKIPSSSTHDRRRPLSSIRNTPTKLGHNLKKLKLSRKRTTTLATNGVSQPSLFMLDSPVFVKKGIAVPREPPILNNALYMPPQGFSPNPQLLEHTAATTTASRAPPNTPALPVLYPDERTSATVNQLNFNVSKTLQSPEAPDEVGSNSAVVVPLEKINTPKHRGMKRAGSSWACGGSSAGDEALCFVQ